MEDNYSIIGNSKAIKEIIELVNRVAIIDTTILITGESGTGKELLANLIHNQSHRNSKPFVSINCAAIPEQLIENEFFGHKKGAFTDATDDYIGKVGFADGGTLFLDEVGDMPLMIQAKLLRFIQFKTYEPVGSTEQLHSDVRIVAATNKNLLKLVKENKFREDLYYRLNVIPIELPPLRERKEDIILLTNHFIAFFNKKYNKNICSISDDLKDAILNCNWFGNIRELQNVIERAVVLSKTDQLTKNLFKPHDTDQSDDNKDKNLKDAIISFKKEYITRQLEKHNWNQTHTARFLQIQRTYLTRLIGELGIDKY